MLRTYSCLCLFGKIKLANIKKFEISAFLKGSVYLFFYTLHFLNHIFWLIWKQHVGHVKEMSNEFKRFKNQLLSKLMFSCLVSLNSLFHPRALKFQLWLTATSQNALPQFAMVNPSLK